jgi:hypothetical protein
MGFQSKPDPIGKRDWLELAAPVPRETVLGDTQAMEVAAALGRAIGLDDVRSGECSTTSG